MEVVRMNGSIDKVGQADPMYALEVR
jgi:hypothetical protein